MSKPRIVKEKFERKRSKNQFHRYVRGFTSWTAAACSECHGRVHLTSRFCIHCGAWFGEPKAKADNKRARGRVR